MNPELLDILIGRHDCRERENLFPFDDGAIRMNAFCIEGKVMWEVWLHVTFWNAVEAGEIGLNPQKLFRREYVN